MSGAAKSMPPCSRKPHGWLSNFDILIDTICAIFDAALDWDRGWNQSKRNNQNNKRKKECFFLTLVDLHRSAATRSLITKNATGGPTAEAVVCWRHLLPPNKCAHCRKNPGSAAMRKEAKICMKLENSQRKRVAGNWRTLKTWDKTRIKRDRNRCRPFSGPFSSF